MQLNRRRLWNWSVASVAALLVLAALVIGAFRVAVLIAPSYRDDIEQYAADFLNRPLEIGDLDLRWRGLHPTIEFTDVYLLTEGGGSSNLELDKLTLGFGLGDLIRGEVVPSQVSLSGALIELERGEDGRVTVKGLAAQGDQPGNLAEQLQRLDQVEVTRADIIWTDRMLDVPPYWLSDAQLILSRSGDDLRVRLAANLPERMSAPDGGRVESDLTVSGDLAADRWTLSGSFGLEGVKPGAWVDEWAGRPLALGGDAARVTGDLQFAPDQPLRVNADITTGGIWHDHPSNGVEALSARLALEWAAATRRISLADLEVTSPNGVWAADRLALDATQSAADAETWVVTASADTLLLEDILHWAVWASPALADSTDWLSRGAGRMRAVDLRMTLRPELRPAVVASANFEGLGIRPGGTIQMSGLSGSISARTGQGADGALGGGRAVIQSGAVTLGVEGRFIEPLAFDAVETTLEWSTTPDQVDLTAAPLDARGYNAALSGMLGLQLPLASGPDAPEPTIDLDVAIDGDNVADLKPLVPLQWGENLRKWLNRALISGRVEGGRLQVRGGLNDIPFHREPGVFRLEAPLSGTELAWSKDWPSMSDVSGLMVIDKINLQVDVTSARSLSVNIPRAKIEIDSFIDQNLLVDATAAGRVRDLLAYVPASPLRQPLGELAAQMSVPDGIDDPGASIDLDLAVPLRAPDDAEFSGTVALRHNTVKISSIDPVLGLIRDAHGALRFSNAGVHAEDVKALVALNDIDVPVSVDLSPSTDTPGATELIARASFSPGRELDVLGSVIPPSVRQHLSGRSRWTASMQLGERAPERIAIRGDLQGVGMSLPAPLDKQSAEQWPVGLSLYLPQPGTTPADADPRAQQSLPLRWQGTLGTPVQGETHVAFDVTSTPAGIPRARLHLTESGRTTPGADVQALAGDVPYSVTGDVTTLDVIAWQEILLPVFAPEQSRDTGATASSANAADVEIDLRADYMPLGATGLRDQAVSGGRSSRGWQLALRGAANGSVRWLGDDDAPAIIRLDTAQFDSIERAPASDAPPAPEDIIDPSGWLALDLSAGSLSFGDLVLGKIELQTSRRRHGVNVDQLRLSGGELTGDLDGYWVRSGGVTRAGVKGRLESTNIDSVIRALGFAPTVQARRSTVVFDLAWPEAVQGVRWPVAAGTLDIALRDGVVSVVDPGAGRMLGLFSFNALPRRLAGDFRDVTDQGLAFDGVDGHFLIGGGRAQTDDLTVDGTSVKVAVSGSVGLQDQTFDQTVTIYPEVSSGLTLAGTIFGGPAVGAVLLVAQELMANPMNQASQFSYHLGGTWDAPEVERASAGDAPAPVGGPRS